MNENIEIKKGIIIEMPKAWLIPLLCLFLIFGSLAIFGRKEKSVSSPSASPSLTLVDFYFSPENITLGVGEETTVDFTLDMQNEATLDGVDVILSFDPQKVKVTDVVPSKLFSFVTFRKEKLDEGKISLTFLEDKSDGMVLKNQNKLLSFSLAGKEAGVTAITIVQADKGAATVITKRGTSEKIKFAARNLVIKIDE